MSTEAAVGSSPLEQLVPKVEHLVASLGSQPVSGDAAHPIHLGWDQITVTTYGVFFAIALVVMLVVVYRAKSKMALAPKGRFVNAFEALFEFVRGNIAGGTIHHNREKYVPILATFFFFVLINNLIGLIPGAKPGTGTISGTFALSIPVFVYFTYEGIKAKGGWGYVKGLVPKGLPTWVVPLIFVIEVVSMLLKPVTQGLRLFANMYAGHIILGIFAILTELFFMAPFHGAGWANMLASPIWFVLLIAMYTLEVVIAAVQAYVFTLLVGVYIDAATGEH